MLTKGNFIRDEGNHLLRHELLDVFLQLKSRTPCRRELKQEGQENNLWWQNRGQ